MKRSTLLLIVGCIVGVICLLCQQRFIENASAPAEEKAIATDTAGAVLREGRRPSVAFILGEDKAEGNPYYQEALRYYSGNASGKTDFVVTTCRSLEEVKNYLMKQAVANAQPWGDVHLISHGNQWSGMSVKVSNDSKSKRATASLLSGYTDRDDFEFLPSSVVDDLTRIFLHGCGVGNDRLLVDAVRLYLGCKESLPMVYAPLLFEFYASDEKGKHAERYLAESWLASYRMDEPPSASSLMNELREQHRDVSIDWQGALTRKKPRWIGDVYHYTFDVPVKWVVAVDAVPDLASEEQQLAWLNGQEEIVKELKRIQLPVTKFKWQFAKGYATDSDGRQHAAVSVKGYCTMLCVVRALAQNDHKNAVHQPVTPQFTDSRYYYSTLPYLIANHNE